MDQRQPQPQSAPWVVPDATVAAVDDVTVASTRAMLSPQLNCPSGVAKTSVGAGCVTASVPRRFLRAKVRLRVAGAEAAHSSWAARRRAARVLPLLPPATASARLAMWQRPLAEFARRRIRRRPADRASSPRHRTITPPDAGARRTAARRTGQASFTNSAASARRARESRHFTVPAGMPSHAAMSRTP